MKKTLNTKDMNITTNDYIIVEDRTPKIEKLGEKIEISLEEYKELLEIKGKYEELKQHPEIKYIYETKPYVDIMPKYYNNNLVGGK